MPNVSLTQEINYIQKWTIIYINNKVFSLLLSQIITSSWDILVFIERKN